MKLNLAYSTLKDQVEVEWVLCSGKTGVGRPREDQHLEGGGERAKNVGKRHGFEGEESENMKRRVDEQWAGSRARK